MIPHLSPWEWVGVGLVLWAVVIAVILLWWCKVRGPAAAAFDHAIKTYPGKFSTRSGGSPPLAGRVDPEFADPDVHPSDEGSAAPAPHLPGAGASNDDTET